jgi:hypothetical protein
MKDDLDTKKILQIMGIVTGAFVIIKGIIDGEYPIKEVSSFIQEDFDWQNPDMGDMGYR